MNFIKKLLKPMVQEMVKEEIDNLVKSNNPKIEKIKTHINRKNKTVWDFLSDNPKEISLCVRWLDSNFIEEFKVYAVKDVPELRHLLKNFKSEHDNFTSVSLHVKPIGSANSLIEQLIESDYYSNNVYESSILVDIFKPIIKWIDERPELLL